MGTETDRPASGRGDATRRRTCPTNEQLAANEVDLIDSYWCHRDSEGHGYEPRQGHYARARGGGSQYVGGGIDNTGASGGDPALRLGQIRRRVVGEW
jgi:hypothetical protein